MNERNNRPIRNLLFLSRIETEKGVFILLKMFQGLVKKYPQLNLFVAGSGIIWRNDSIVNKVASPVKFSEYLCAGLPVIANDNVDLISELIEKSKCGFIVNTIQDINDMVVRNLLKIDRRKIIQIGMENFEIYTISEKYYQYYQDILKK